LFERLKVLHNRIGDLVGSVPQLIPAAGSVGKENSEEDGWLATPIFAKRVLQTYNVVPKLRLEIVDSVFELVLLCKRLGNVHYLIIALQRTQLASLEGAALPTSNQLSYTTTGTSPDSTVC
jgi:hypothetical protein